jgi:uncharacterized protein YecE (DUF72 family)
MAKIYAGTSGWAYDSWKPDFYPAKLSAAKFLDYYSTQLNSVEVNYTFRRMPSEKLLKRWIDSTPSAFKFAVKAHFRITHSRRLRDAAEPTANFIASLEPLRKAGRLGPVLFQSPPNLKCDVKLLKDFVVSLPSHIQSAFEFRHPSWFSDEVYGVLREGNVALCQAESEDIETPQIDAALFSYLRLRKEKYSAKACGKVAARVRQLAQRGDVFVYFKHEETPEGARYARSLLKMLAANAKGAR